MHFQGVAGLLVLTGFAWIISENRAKVNYRGVLAGIALQISIAALLLYVPAFRSVFLFLNRLVLSLEESTRAGTSFVFGYIGGGTPPFSVRDPGSNFILAFQALPLVLVIGALSSLFFSGESCRIL